VGESAFFLSVIFPHNQMQILPYNRVLRDLNSLSPGTLLEKLATVFTLQRHGAPKPTRKHELGLFLDGHWHTLSFLPRFTAAADPIEKLDVTLLQKYVLEPVFDISDPRTSKRVNFVGGIRGTAELEKLVNSGENACAFSMFPTSIEDLMTMPTPAHHAAEEYLVRAQAPRRDVLSHDLTVGRDGVAEGWSHAAKRARPRVPEVAEVCPVRVSSAGI